MTYYIMQGQMTFNDPCIEELEIIEYI